MKKVLIALAALASITPGLSQTQAQNTVGVRVTIRNIAPARGVAITPPWVGFHSGSFDSYNGGLTALPAIEQVAEDGNNALLSRQFNDFNRTRGGYTFIDNSRSTPRSRLVRTGDRSDRFRQDATLGSSALLPGDSVSEFFELRRNGSNDFFSYVSMVLPSNDFFLANGSPVAHDIGDLLDNGGRTSFFIGTPGGGVNDAGTERENFRFSAGNGLFPNRNLPSGQSGPNQGQSVSLPISNVEGFPFRDFRLISRGNESRLEELEEAVARAERRIRRLGLFPGARDLVDTLEQRVENFRDDVEIDLRRLNFNRYQNGIARVTITVITD